MTDLSIIIPAREEMFLARTIEDILENMRGDTEIIAVCDGEWPDPPVDDHDQVTLVRHSKSIGQRACINNGANLSEAKYLMKVDAHCAFDEGFDVKMMADMQPDWTFVPTMKNLRVFEWLCPNGHRRYQGKSGPCTECGEPTKRDIIWKPKKSPNSTAFRFDKELHFQYWGGYKSRQIGDLVETMTIQGSCFMVTRDKYMELGLCDEGHGSWGQQGVEVACKTWLSGGRLIVSRKTWYAHLFRTQGGDFGFPYPNPGISKAREYSRNLWLGDNWDGAIYPFSWLIEKFKPIPDWHEPDPAPAPPAPDFPTVGSEENKPMYPEKGIVYYTDNRLNKNIFFATQRQIHKAIKGTDIEVVSVSLEKLRRFGKNVVLDLKRSPLTMFKQILAGLEKSTAKVVFFCEHDILYHPSHFDFVPPKEDVFYYNTNVWKARWGDGHAMRTDFCQQTSGLCAYKDLLIEHYRKRIAMVEENGYSTRMGFEPGTHGRAERIDDYLSDSWESEFPNIDIRHGFNLTPTRWNPDEYRNKRYIKGWKEADEVPGWGATKDLFDQIVKEA